MFSCTCTHTSCYVMVILGWGWVGWGGAMTFMSTCTHTSCYVMFFFSCTCSHTSCYAMVILGWGGVGWGNDVHVNLHTHVMLRYCYVLLHLHTHTRHATLWLFSLALAHTRHATLWLSWGGVGWGNDVHVNLHTHTSCYGIVMFSCTKEHPELEKFVLGYCWRKSLGPLTPHRFLEELCKAVKAMKRFWEEGKKVLHPKKTRTYVKKRSSFGDFQNPIFHVNMRKNDVSL